MKHMLSLMDWSADDLDKMIKLAIMVKGDQGSYRKALDGRTLAMIFEKPSTRTRVSFEIGMHQLGGKGLFLSSSDMQLGRGETIADTAKVLGRYVDGIMARVFEHQKVIDLTEGGVPVVNGLSDLLHPCQALADVQTIVEHKGKARGVKVAYVGDGCNVCHSLINAAARFGFELNVATPAGMEPAAAIVKAAEADGAVLNIGTDPDAAVAGVDVLYTDVWASMGQEAEAEARKKQFAPFQVNDRLFGLAASDAIFMHCLPAHRGEEVIDSVVDHKRSVVLDQAENRLHAQSRLLLTLMGND